MIKNMKNILKAFVLYINAWYIHKLREKFDFIFKFIN